MNKFDPHTLAPNASISVQIRVFKSNISTGRNSLVFFCPDNIGYNCGEIPYEPIH